MVLDPYGTALSVPESKPVCLNQNGCARNASAFQCYNYITYCRLANWQRNVGTAEPWKWIAGYMENNSMTQLRQSTVGDTPELTFLGRVISPNQNMEVGRADTG